MGARANSIRLSIKRPRHDVARSITTLSAQEIQRYYTKTKFDATYCMRKFAVVGKFYISEAESMIHEQNFVFWRNFKKRLIGTTNLRQ